MAQETLTKLDNLIRDLSSDEKQSNNDIASVEIGKDCKGNTILMPILGFGLYMVTNENMEQVVRNAIDVGYRHFDGASFYKNEKSFGDVISKLIKENKIKRSDIFITSKVWMDKMSYKDTIESAKQSLADLGKDIGYFDLFLVHWPRKNMHIECYDAILELYYNHITRAIGVSNYLANDFIQLLNGFGLQINEKVGKIEEIKDKDKDKDEDKNIYQTKNKFVLPMINQLHINPLYYQKDLFDFHKKYVPGLVIQAYKPLERGGKDLLENELMVDLAKKCNCTVAQLCIQWGLQHKFVVLVKSSNKGRMKQNIDTVVVLGAEKNGDNKGIDVKDLETIDGLTNKDSIEKWMKRYQSRKTQYDE